VSTARHRAVQRGAALAVDLSALPIAAASPTLVEFGGLLTPALGGPVQRIERAGSRWSIAFETSTMRVEPDGRAWAARLARATREGALIEIPQPDLVIGMPGTVTTATNIASGRLVALAGLTAGYTIREGQWLSIIVAGQRYADQVTAAVTASSGGTATATLQNLLRVPLAGGETVEIASPKIEGWIDGSFGWGMPVERTTSLSFSVTEAA
jgi:hypothetical protein